MSTAVQNSAAHPTHPWSSRHYHAGFITFETTKLRVQYCTQQSTYLFGHATLVHWYIARASLLPQSPVDRARDHLSKRAWTWMVAMPRLCSHLPNELDFGVKYDWVCSRAPSGEKTSQNQLYKASSCLLMCACVCACLHARVCMFTKGFVYPAAWRQKQPTASIDGWSCSTCVDWVQRSAVTGNQE